MPKLHVRLAACTLALALLSACQESGGNGAEAEANRTAEFAAAADALLVKLRDTVPPASDPAVTAFDAEATRAMDTLGTPALPLDGFESFEAVCGKTAEIVGAYASRGVEGLPPAEQAAQMERNVGRNMDQMFTPLLFAAHCTAAHLPFMAGTIGSDVGDKADAVAQIRQGAFAQVQGLLEMAAAPDLDAQRKSRIVDLLAADADEFAIVLSQTQRQQLAGAAEAVRGAVPEASRGKIDDIRSGFTSPECGPLCQM